MARWLYPQDATAIVYKGPLLPLLQPKHHSIKVFVDANCTIPADILDLNNAAIPQSTVFTGTDGLIPQFKGPDGIVVLWGKNLSTGRKYRMDALFSYQITNLQGQIDTIGTGGGGGGGGGGTPAPAGPAFLVGSGPPSNSTGVPGDAYLDTTGGFLYGPKTSVWPYPPTSLKGPKGDNGGSLTNDLSSLTDVALNTTGQPFDRTAFLGRTEDGTKWTNRRVSWEMIDNKPSNFVTTSDARLTDARTPLSHVHPQSDVTGLTAALAAKVDSAALTAGLATKVDTTRAVNAGTGLTGGGTLAADRTISVVYGTTAGTAAQGNDARLSDARTPLTHSHAQSDVTGLAAALAAKVDGTRSVIAGTGLTGGGDLTADRTLAVAYGTTAGTAAQGNDARLSDARTPLTHSHAQTDVTGLVAALATKVDTTRQVIAGTGLTGGGTLAADRTLAVAYGTTAGTAAQGNDARLSDARTPLTHSHAQSDVTGLVANLAAKDATLTDHTSRLVLLEAAGGSAGGDVKQFIWVSGAWAPAIPLTAPAGVRRYDFYGPSQPTGLPGYVGTNIAGGQILATYTYAATT